MKAPRLRDTIDHVSSEAIGTETRLAPRGSVLLLVRGMGLARDLPVAVTERAMTFNQDVKALVPRDPRLGPFIRAAIYHRREHLLSRIVPSAHGTMTLNLDDVERLQIPMPDSVDEALAIGRVLEVVQEMRELSLDQLAAARSLKRSATQRLLTRGVRSETQRETDIGPVPKTWEIVRVESNAVAISKGASPRWQGFNYVDEGILFVRSQNVGDGVMVWNDRVFLPVQWNEKEPRSILREGDVLVNLVGASIGRSAVGGSEIDGANCNQAVCFVRLNQPEILPGFLSAFLLSEAGQSQIHGKKKDIARANLSLQDIRRISMPKPSIDEQTEIVDILGSIDRNIELNRQKRGVLDDLFNALLHKLMTREIFIGDLDFAAFNANFA